MSTIIRTLRVLLLMLVASTGIQAAEASLESRLRVLEDKEAIRTLLLDYGRHLDGRNWDAFANLFAENGGTWNGGMGIASGHQQIRDMMTSTIGADNAGTGGTGMANLHLLGNEIIDVDGDTATATSKWVFVMTGGGGPEMVFVGHYDDELVRENDVWKFRLRTVTGDITRPVVLPGLENTGDE